MFASCLLCNRGRVIGTLLSGGVWKKVEPMLAWQGRRPRSNVCGQSLVSRSRAVDRPHWQPVGRSTSAVRLTAHNVHAFSRWRRKGVWQRVAHVVAGETRIEHIPIDSIIVGAHRHSARVTPKECQQARGRRAVGWVPNCICPWMHRPPVAADGHRRTGCRYLVYERTDRAPARKGSYCGQELQCRRLGEDNSDCQGEGCHPTTLESQDEASLQTYVVPHAQPCRTLLYRIKHFCRVCTHYDKLAHSYFVFASLACAFGPIVKM